MNSGCMGSMALWSASGMTNPGFEIDEVDVYVTTGCVSDVGTNPPDIVNAHGGVECCGRIEETTGCRSVVLGCCDEAASVIKAHGCTIGWFNDLSSLVANTWWVADVLSWWS